MTKDKFKQLLDEAEITQKELSIILDTSNQTINNWGSNGRDIPYWVESWLQNYIKAKDIELVAKVMKPYIKCDE